MPVIRLIPSSDRLRCLSRLHSATAAPVLVRANRHTAPPARLTHSTGSPVTIPAVKSRGPPCVHEQLEFHWHTGIGSHSRVPTAALPGAHFQPLENTCMHPTDTDPAAVRTHCSKCRCPISLYHFKGSPCDRSHSRTSMWPPSAAHKYVRGYQGALRASPNQYVEGPALAAP
jgi:hypothetical protein